MVPSFYEPTLEAGPGDFEVEGPIIQYSHPINF